MSQIGDFIIFFTPSGSLFGLLVIVSIFLNSGMTLAHDSQPSQALDADPASAIVIRKADDERRRGVRGICCAGDCWTTVAAGMTAACSWGKSACIFVSCALARGRECYSLHQKNSEGEPE
jgi:hypothetical protein